MHLSFDMLVLKADARSYGIIDASSYSVQANHDIMVIKTVLESSKKFRKYTE